MKPQKHPIDTLHKLVNSLVYIEISYLCLIFFKQILNQMIKKVKIEIIEEEKRIQNKLEENLERDKN
jgi:hypothetical protein